MGCMCDVRAATSAMVTVGRYAPSDAAECIAMQKLAQWGAEPALEQNRITLWLIFIFSSGARNK